MDFHTNVLTFVSQMNAQIPVIVLIQLVIVTRNQLVCIVNSRLVIPIRQNVPSVGLVSIYQRTIGKKMSIHFSVGANLISITATAAKKNYVLQNYASMVELV